MRSGRDPPEPLGSKAREELLEEIYRYGGEHSAREVGLEIGGKGDRVRTGVLGRREIDGDVRGHEEIVERREEEEKRKFHEKNYKVLKLSRNKAQAQNKPLHPHDELYWLSSHAKGKADVERATVLLKLLLRDTPGRLASSPGKRRKRRTAIYNTFVKTCVTAGDMASAVKTLLRMKDEGVGLTNRTFSKLFAGCHRNSNVEMALQIEELMLKSDIEIDLISQTNMMYVLASVGDLEAVEHRFQSILDQGISPDEQACCALLLACHKNNNLKRGFYWYKYVCENLKANGLYFETHMVFLIAQEGSVDETKQWIRNMYKRRHAWDVKLYNSVILVLRDLKEYKEAVYWANQLRELEEKTGGRISRSTSTFNLVIDIAGKWAPGKSSIVDKAEMWFQELLTHKRARPDVVSFNSILEVRCYADAAMILKNANKFLDQMSRYDIKGDIWTFNIFLRACSKVNPKKYTMILHCLRERKLEMDVYTFKQLLICAIRLRDLDLAWKVYRKMLQHLQDSRRKDPQYVPPNECFTEMFKVIKLPGSKTEDELWKLLSDLKRERIISQANPKIHIEALVSIQDLTRRSTLSQDSIMKACPYAHFFFSSIVSLNEDPTFWKIGMGLLVEIHETVGDSLGAKMWRDRYRTLYEREGEKKEAQKIVEDILHECESIAGDCSNTRQISDDFTENKPQNLENEHALTLEAVLTQTESSVPGKAVAGASE